MTNNIEKTSSSTKNFSLEKQPQKWETHPCVMRLLLARRPLNQQQQQQQQESLGLLGDDDPFNIPFNDWTIDFPASPPPDPPSSSPLLSLHPLSTIAGPPSVKDSIASSCVSNNQENQRLSRKGGLPLFSNAANYLQLFALKQQPNPSQRKAYSKESRFILPNPIIIEANKCIQNRLQHAIVHVKLIGENGEDLKSVAYRQAQSKGLEGTLVQLMDSSGIAIFSLKCILSSERSKFRLCFTILYQLEGTEKSCCIVFSSPFSVTSKKCSSTLPMPRLDALKPTGGPENTEVWIKGYYFSKKARVWFGENEAKVLDVREHIIICNAPPMSTSQTVEVRVDNCQPRKRSKEEVKENLISNNCFKNRKDTKNLRKSLLFTYRDH